MNVVIVNCFDTYENRVDLLYDYFTKNGDCVKVYTSNFRHFQKCERKDFSKGYSFVKTVPYKKNISLRRIWSHVKFAENVRRIIEKQIADVNLLWVMVPPNSLVKQMSALKKKYDNVKLVFDVIDVWPESMPLNGVEKLPFIRFWKNLRDKYIANADMVVTECKLFQEKIKEHVPTEKMFNLYFAKRDSEVCAKDDLASDVFELCYLGSINNIVDIDVIGEIVKQLSQMRKIKLHIIGDGEHREELINVAAEFGAQVEFYGIVYDNIKKSEIFSRCHMGLNIMKDSVCVGLTMKSIDYFEAGLPMINNIQGDTWNIIEQFGFGVNYPFNVDDIRALNERKYVRQKMRDFYGDNFSEKAFGVSLKEMMSRI